MKISKKVTCFLLIMVLMLTSLSSTVLASNLSKNVTYTKTYSFVIDPQDYPKYYESPSTYVPYTYYYNDGTYQGTLTLNYAYCGPPDGVVGNFIRLNIHANYSGTVVVPNPSKSVTVSRTYTFQIRPEQLPDYMSSPSSYVPPVIYYDDGSYSGYIYLSYAACGAPNSSGNYLYVTISTQYSGTVIKKL